MDTHNARQTGRMLDRTKDGRAISFAVESPQIIRDPWRQTDRVMRYYGACYCCGIRTYAFDDGENDPRGILGDHAADTFHLADHLAPDDAAEVERFKLRDIPACFGCTNDYDRYQMLIAAGTRRARKMGANI